MFSFCTDDQECSCSYDILYHILKACIQASVRDVLRWISKLRYDLRYNENRQCFRTRYTCIRKVIHNCLLFLSL